MQHASIGKRRLLFGLICGIALGAAPRVDGAAGSVRSDPSSVLEILREGGCGGLQPPARVLQREASLDRAARDWAAGQTLAQATDHSGYLAERTSAIHVMGPAGSMMQTLRQSSCKSLLDPAMQDVGIFRRGADTWFVLAARYSVPSNDEAPALAARTLELVNQARARTTRCGERSFAPAPAVTLSGTLDGVALGHATDMAVRNYFEHEDPDGHTPADRVRASGYREKIVGENIAFGPRTPEEVVRGWLDSPGHCENIMDPRFAQMGIAYAAGHAKRGLYWVQLFAAPRA